MDLADAITILAAAGIETPRLEARLLLAFVLKISNASVIAGTYAALRPEQTAEFARLIAERARRVPLAYLRGTQEFYALEFAVSPAVLIPRPETEWLTEIAVRKAAQNPAGPFVLADVGTGSGCIIVSAAKNQGNIQAAAFDISSEALEIARSNAARHGVSERVRFVQGDLLTGARPESFDLIVSNPPYIPAGEIAGLQPEVGVYEPKLALAGGADGLEIYRRLIPQAWRALKWDGGLSVEVGQAQAQAVEALMRGTDYFPVTIQNDLAGIERFVSGTKSRRGW